MEEKEEKEKKKAISYSKEMEKDVLYNYVVSLKVRIVFLCLSYHKSIKNNV